MKITILYGGKSGEHEVSLVSAASVARNNELKKIQMQVCKLKKNIQL